MDVGVAMVVSVGVGMVECGCAICIHCIYCAICIDCKCITNALHQARNIHLSLASQSVVSTSSCVWVWVWVYCINTLQVHSCSTSSTHDIFIACKLLSCT